MKLNTAKKPSDIAACVAEFLKAGDLEGIVSMFHPDCQIFFPPTEPPILGLEGARSVFTDFVKIRPTLISNITSEIINGDIALLHGNWSILDQDGNLLAEGNSTEVAKKFEHGGWGYLIDCPDGPPVI